MFINPEAINRDLVWRLLVAVTTGRLLPIVKSLPESTPWVAEFSSSATAKDFIDSRPSEKAIQEVGVRS